MFEVDFTKSAEHRKTLIDSISLTTRLGAIPWDESITKMPTNIIEKYTVDVGGLRLTARKITSLGHSETTLEINGDESQHITYERISRLIKTIRAYFKKMVRVMTHRNTYVKLFSAVGSLATG